MLTMQSFLISDKEEAVNSQVLIRSKPKFCRHCDIVVMNSGIKKQASEVTFLSKDELVSVTSSVYCFYNFG